ncbi:hypothetical protein BDV40DRAFT_195471 [Aspergillus tamarii]|uniref:Uncharacterized protein n=1 Tax=Aspergillus tamarii TaxID=41984 RepID=A0A5N6UR82_ASPTM|nr:hypothetical protein BDV40DRAFT_195471 [Aspergillus tamarii]
MFYTSLRSVSVFINVCSGDPIVVLFLLFMSRGTPCRIRACVLVLHNVCSRTASMYVA